MTANLFDLDIIWVILIMIGATALFIWQIFSVEVVSMIVLGSLMALNLVTPQEAVSGFSNPATVTVAAMFVLSYALKQTGALENIVARLEKLSKNPTLMLMMLMALVGAASAFINNTGVVAVFLPLAALLAEKCKTPLSRLLIPISYMAQAGGVCTLIGTSTNLLVNSLYMDAGYPSISMFEMGQLGVLLCACVILYFLLLGPWILPDRPSNQLVDTFDLKHYITELLVLEGSKLIGQKIPDTDLLDKGGVRLLKILRDNISFSAWKEEVVRQGDILLVETNLQELRNLKSAYNLEVAPEFDLKDETLKEDDKFLTNVIIAPRSTLIGKTLQNVWFQDRYNLIVIAIRRKLGTIWEKLNKTRLQFGDNLLVQGSKNAIERLSQDDDFIVFQEAKPTPMAASKFLIPIAVIISVVLAAAIGIMPIMVASILGCILLLITRCIRPSDAYRAIDWSVIFLLAGMIPLSIAITKSGAANLIADGVLYVSEGQSLAFTLAIFYAVAAILTEFMSNNATAVLLAPIAISAAVMLGVDPKPFVLAIAFAASTSFSTPVGYQTNAMIYTPGGYRYLDFVKSGVPLNLFFFVIVVYFIPKIWPF